MIYDKLAVIIKTKEGDIHQVALDQEMSDYLCNELTYFFKDGKIKVLPEKITGIDLY